MARKGTVGDLLVNLRMEMGQLRTDVKEAERTLKGGFGAIASAAKGVAAGIAAGFSLRAVTNFSRAILDNVARLKDLEVQTGITAQTLSGIQSSVSNAGISVEEFAQGWSRLVQSLTSDSGTNKASERLRQLGFSAEQLRTALDDPDAFLSQFASKMAAIENPAHRLAIAMDIAGRSGGRFAGALADMGDKFDEIRRGGLSQSTIDNLDRFKDQVDALSISFRNMAAGPLLAVIEGMRELGTLATTTGGGITQSFAELFATMTGGISPINSVINLLGHLAAGLLQVQKSMLMIGRTPFTLAQIFDPEAFKEATAEIDRLIADVDSRLGRIREQLAGLGSTALAGAQTGGVAGLLGSRQSLPAATGTDKAKEAADKFIESLQKQANQLRLNITELTHGGDAARNMGFGFEIAAFKAKMLADGMKLPPGFEAQLDAMVAELRDLQGELGETTQSAKDMAQLMGEDFSDLDFGIAKAAERAETATAKWNARLAESARLLKEIRDAQFDAFLHQDSEEFGSDVFGAGLDQELKRQGAAIEESWQGVFSVIDAGSGAIRTTVNGILLGTQSVSDAFANMARNIAISMAEAAFQVTILEPAIKSLKDALIGLSTPGQSGGGGGISGIFGTIASGIGSLFSGFTIPGLATGGMVTQPTLAMVGERGPEAVIPLPKLAGMGGGVQNNMQVIVRGGIVPEPGVSPADVIQIVARDLDNRGVIMGTLESRMNARR